MSGPSTSQSDGAKQQGKQMSSRLMTMKFMQRSSPATRVTSQSSTPTSEPPSKRRRTDDGSNTSAPDGSRPKPQSYISRFGVAAALRIRPALEELASQGIVPHNSVDTQWVLNVPLPTPDTTSEDEGEATDGEDDVDWNDTSGRQTYGSYKKKKTTPGKRAEAKTPTYSRKSDQFDDDEDGEISEGASSEEVDESDESPRPNRTASGISGMDYSNEDALAALDRTDLSKSSYAKSKGAYVPNGRASSGSKFGRNGLSSAGKFKNKDKVHKKTNRNNR